METRIDAAKLILAVRSLMKGEAAKKSIKETTKRTGIMKVWQMDLSSYESVKQFVKRVEGTRSQSSQPTSSAPIYWTLMILPKLRETVTKSKTTPHLMIVSSEVHYFTTFPEKSSADIFQTLNGKETANMGDSYSHPLYHHSIIINSKANPYVQSDTTSPNSSNKTHTPGLGSGINSSLLLPTTALFNQIPCSPSQAALTLQNPPPPNRLKFKEDYRARLSVHISRFLGYRPPGSEPPYDPLPFPPFTWLPNLPLRYEVLIFAWLGSFVSILLIEAIMSTQTAFRDIYRSPIIVTSFGASAVLVFGVIESPLAQPRNVVLGHFVSALIGTAITRLFVLNARYMGYLDNSAFHGTTFINGGLSMATSLLGQQMIGAVHPPAGATGPQCRGGG
ncbi:hypothetical protein MMC08_007494 [Hypocenomyce scalaris]|nr:hypothetical protein [Hypocenomyce scalaris]